VVICGDIIEIIKGDYIGLTGMVEAKSHDGNLWGSWGDFPLTVDMVKIIIMRDLY